MAVNKDLKVPEVIGSKSVEEHVGILLDNYEKFFSESLIANTSDALEELWSADFVVVSHGVASDPLFNFGNQTALNLFELSFSQFTELPSRTSAELISQAERDKLLAEVTKHGCMKHYTGVRISSTGKRFFIEDARVWNLYDENSEYYGQAAMFKSWKYL